MPDDFGSAGADQSLHALTRPTSVAPRLTKTVNGVSGVSKLGSLSLEQTLPAPMSGWDVNTCPDPDCPNFGTSASFSGLRLVGRNAASKRAALRATTSIIGVGDYKLASNAKKQFRRVSTVLEYQNDPHTWSDRRNVECRCEVGGRMCTTEFDMLSNEHLLEEVRRLRNSDGVLDGDGCKACGKPYLDAPEEFILNGVHERRAAREDARTSRAARVRLIHLPCRGKKGARFSITLDHHRQRVTKDNLQIVQAIVNGAGINDIARMLAPAGTGRAIGISRVYNRIFAIEKALLAFERAQLRRWRQKEIDEGFERRQHLAHDDIVIGVNWETSAERRITQLNISATADVPSGYVFRLDTDFDPRISPADLFVEAYLDDHGLLKNLRKDYQQKSGVAFTAPLMTFQRPTGRLDEQHFFAAAAGQLEVFLETQVSRMPEGTPAEIAAKAALVAEIQERVALIRTIHQGYFNLPPSRRDRRTPFTGTMTRDIYTKAAHLELVRQMLPPGRITLVTEQEGILPRVIPHVFREAIEEDAFVWLAMTFDKEVKKPEMQRRVAAYKVDLEAFLESFGAQYPQQLARMSQPEKVRAYILDRMTTAVEYDRAHAPQPYPSANFQQPHMPAVWIRCPIQTAGETGKVVGFPLMRSELRQRMKAIPFNGQVTDDYARVRVAYYTWAATLQPVATFFNALRARQSLAQRAGGRSARSGPSYINGAAFNPRTLTAMLNIFRVYYNYFEARPYVAPWSPKAETEEVAPARASKRVPGIGTVVQVEKRRSRQPVKRTPAMRLGIQEERRDKDGRLIMPSLLRVLYRPWLYAGTPVWDKFENPKGDQRKTRHRRHTPKNQSAERAA